MDQGSDNNQQAPGAPSTGVATAVSPPGADTQATTPPQVSESSPPVAPPIETQPPPAPEATMPAKPVDTLSTDTPPKSTTGATFEPPGEKKAVKIIGLIVLAIVVIGGLGFLGYYLGSNNILNPEPSPTPPQTIEPIATSTPTPTPDPTVNWKAYSNEDYNFTFSYPPDYTNVGEVAGPVTGDSKLIRSFSDPLTIKEDTDAPFDGFSLYIVTDLSKLDFEDYLKDELKVAQTSSLGNKEAVISEMTVSGITASYINYNDNVSYYYILSTDGESIVFFSRNSASDDFPSTFNQILNTFKFTVDTSASEKDK